MELCKKKQRRAEREPATEERITALEEENAALRDTVDALVLAALEV